MFLSSEVNTADLDVIWDVATDSMPSSYSVICHVAVLKSNPLFSGGGFRTALQRKTRMAASQRCLCVMTFITRTSEAKNVLYGGLCHRSSLKFSLKSLLSIFTDEVNIRNVLLCFIQLCLWTETILVKSLLLQNKVDLLRRMVLSSRSHVQFMFLCSFSGCIFKKV